MAKKAPKWFRDMKRSLKGHVKKHKKRVKGVARQHIRKHKKAARATAAGYGITI